MQEKSKGSNWPLALASIGVVYGDIGTSPLYAVKQCIQDHPDSVHVMGAISLVIWYLLAIVSLKYVWCLLKLNNHGEGGVFALLALSKNQPRPKAWLAVLLIFGAALLYGDGVITPAISVLSAVEGIAPPEIDHVTNPAAWANPLIASIILVGLFAVQRFGTHRICSFFSPIMVLWFGVIACLGIKYIIQAPEILWAFNPFIGIRFLWTHPGEAMAMLGFVTLAVTGAEALYADLGHFGQRAIALAWNSLVCPCLILNYLGQGAFALHHPEATSNLFFSMAPQAWRPALTGLSILATVIASQALISGVFSLTRQAINLGYYPRTTIRFTHENHPGQIYLPVLNTLLGLGCIALVIIFRKSDNLADAYGLAVTGTMAITTVAYGVLTHRPGKIPWIPAGLLVLDLSLLIPNTTKFLTGGYVPLMIGACVAAVLFSWHRTRREIRSHLQERLISLKDFYEQLQQFPVNRVKHTAVFLSASAAITPLSLLHWLKISQILHEKVVILTLITDPQPRVTAENRVKVTNFGDTLYGLEVHYGYMDEPDIEKLEPALRDAIGLGIDRRVYYFLGREILINRKSYRWEPMIYRWLARNSRPASEYLRIPPGQMIEIGAAIHV